MAELRELVEVVAVIAKLLIQLSLILVDDDLTVHTHIQNKGLHRWRNSFFHTFKRMQWAGEEYLLAEIADTAGLTKGAPCRIKRCYIGQGTSTASGTSQQARTVKRYSAKLLQKP